MAGSAIKIGMKCEDCNDINFTTTKNPKNMTEKFSTKKHCRRCNKHTIHKETKLKS